MEKIRCKWSHGVNEKYTEYHDTQWGVPVHEDRELFESLVLEGAQAGLSWATILSKRDGYKKNFADFDPHKIAEFADSDLEQKLDDASIVRNKLKIFSVRKNARAFIAVQQEYGSFASYLWKFTKNSQINKSYINQSDVPVATTLSTKISNDLKRRNFTFVGPTIVYAYMQAVGLTNDHTIDCFRHKEILEHSNVK